jgi:hypothetical protein
MIRFEDQNDTQIKFWFFKTILTFLNGVFVIVFIINNNYKTMKTRKRKLINKRKFLTFFKRKKNKRIIIISFSSLILLIFLYYIISFFFVSSFSLCLEKLRRTYNDQVICRDICFKQREEFKKCLKNALAKNDRYKDELKEIILNENEELQFRKDLILLFSETYSNNYVPVFLNEYFKNDRGNEEIKKEIVNLYDFSGGINDYLYMLENNFPLRVKRAAIVKISSIEDKSDYSLEQVRRIENLIFSENISDKLRQDLVLLLGSYRELFKRDVDDVLEKVYKATFTNDNISRAFAADFLGKDEVEVDESEWQNYFTN